MVRATSLNWAAVTTTISVTASDNRSKPKRLKHPALRKRLQLLKTKPKKDVQKLTFKEQRELEQLPDRIGAERSHSSRPAHAQMAAPDFFKQPPDAIKQVTQQLADLEQQLTQLYQRWEELESRQT